MGPWKMNAVIFAFALTLDAGLSYSAPDNQPEYKKARVTVIQAIHRIYEDIRTGRNIQQLAPADRALLRADMQAVRALLPGATTDVLATAQAAAGLGLAKGVAYVDNTNRVLTAWRWDGSKWKKAGYDDPAKRLSLATAFQHAHSWPSDEGVSTNR